MKKMMTAIAAITLVMGVTACNGAKDDSTEASASAGTLAGTWKVNLDSAKFENDNRKLVIADGTYTCESCIPPFSTTADGEWQAVDRPGMDGLKITVVDDKTIKSESRLGNKDLGNSTWTVGDDGKSMTIAWANLDGDEVVKGSTAYSRVAAGPDGSHAASGEWTVSEMGEMNDAGLLFSYSIDGDTLTSTSNGGGYTATLGGEAVTPEGDESGGVVAVEKLDGNAYRETYSRDGEVINVLNFSVDGDTLTGVSTDPRDDSTVNWTATRQ